MAGKGNKQMPLLGPGRLLGGGLGIPGADYLLRDTFDTDRAAGALDGTPVDGVGGVRSVVDTDGDAALITGSKLRLQNPNNYSGDPGVWWSAQARVPGRMLVATATYAAYSGFSYPIGWDASIGGLGHHQFRLTGAGNVQLYNGSVGPTLGTLGTGTHVFVVIVRAAGATYFVKPDGASSYLFYYMTNDGSLDPLHPAVMTFSQTTFDVDDVIVPAARWLPSPLVSDGFSVWGTSDGLGHAEGVVGGIGSGGGGEEWTAAVGTWAAAAGVAAATALSGGIAIATASAAADVIVSVRVTRTAGKAGLVLRRGGTINYVYVVVTGTHVQVYKRISNTETNLQDIPTTNVDGAALTVIIEGSVFRIYYNNLLVVTEAIADGSVQSSPLVGLYTTDTGNTFDDFVAYARGTNGEYDAVLDAI